MQGSGRSGRQLLDAAALAGHLVPAGSMFAFLAADRAEVFRDGGYAGLFARPGAGRASVPATQVAAVMTLQGLRDYPDRETAGAVRFDVRWKAAIGVPPDDAGFGSSALAYWRRRIAEPARPRRVNDAVRKVIEQTGVLKGRRRRAAGSAIVADAVAAQDTVTQVVPAIRRVAREVPGAAGQIAAVCTGHDCCGPGRPKIGWDGPQAKDALVSELVNDADALVAVLQDRGLDEPAASALALLALAAGQDAGPAEGPDGTGGRWRIARRVAGDRVISAADPDARHARKSSGARRDGYRAHVAAGPETGIITGGELTRAAGEENSGAAAAGQMMAREPEAAEVYGDTACGTGDLRAALARGGRTAVIKPRPLRPAVEGGLTLDDFTAGERAGTVTCPNGITRRITARRDVTFGAACRDCPLRDEQDRPGPHPARARRPAARCPPRLARQPGPARELPQAPARCGTRSCPGRHLAGTAPQAPLPQRDQEQRLAQAPHRRLEPAQPDRPGPDPPGRDLGTSHLTSQPAQHGRPARPKPGRQLTDPGSNPQSRTPGTTGPPGNDRNENLDACRQPANWPISAGS